MWASGSHLRTGIMALVPGAKGPLQPRHGAAQGAGAEPGAAPSRPSRLRPIPLHSMAPTHGMQES